MRSVNSKTLLTAAVLDVLKMNCNRDLGDLYFNELGELKLVNTDHIFGFAASGKRCLTNSIFIPQSQNFKIASYGLAYVTGMNPNPRKSPHLAQLLDYRCHIGEGRTSLGTSYPSEIESFLDWVSNIYSLHTSSPQSKFGKLRMRNAERLEMRAREMLSRGFEWTILHGGQIDGKHNIEDAKTSNRADNDEDDILPALCCEIEVASDGKLTCA